LKKEQKKIEFPYCFPLCGESPHNGNQYGNSIFFCSFFNLFLFLAFVQQRTIDSDNLFNPILVV
jgi:hypothetical protein